jgi:hypothetical protein
MTEQLLTEVQIERLAGMAAKLRPDWPARSVKTYLATRQAHRPFADLAVALAVIATDPSVDTPARLDQHGRWWVAAWHANGARTDIAPTVGPGRDAERCPEFGHEHEAAHHCRACRADAIAAKPEGNEA